MLLYFKLQYSYSMFNCSTGTVFPNAVLLLYFQLQYWYCIFKCSIITVFSITVFLLYFRLHYWYCIFNYSITVNGINYSSEHFFPSQSFAIYSNILYTPFTVSYCTYYSKILFKLQKSVTVYRWK